jgi:hypothetical protein
MEKKIQTYIQSTDYTNINVKSCVLLELKQIFLGLNSHGSDASANQKAQITPSLNYWCERIERTKIRLPQVGNFSENVLFVFKTC